MAKSKNVMAEQVPTLDKSKWIPTEWSHVDDLARFNIGIVIRRMVSPFYEGEKFAAMSGDQCCLAKDGKREYQPMPSSRTDAFYKRCRFDSFDEAVEAVAKYSKANAAMSGKER